MVREFSVEVQPEMRGRETSENPKITFLVEKKEVLKRFERIFLLFFREFCMKKRGGFMGKKSI